jgi:predicted nucleic acid-binding protein
VRRIFLDTNHLTAAFNEDDDLHATATARVAELRNDASIRYVTLLPNLTEFLAYASSSGPGTRARAAVLVDRIRSSSGTDVLDGDRALFDEGLALYRGRLDKSYSHVDCMAMIVCQRMQISEVLTGDRDFQREGLTILL